MGEDELPQKQTKGTKETEKKEDLTQRCRERAEECRDFCNVKSVVKSLHSFASICVHSWLKSSPIFFVLRRENKRESPSSSFCLHITASFLFGFYFLGF